MCTLPPWPLCALPGTRRIEKPQAFQSSDCAWPLGERGPLPGRLSADVGPRSLASDLFSPRPRVRDPPLPACAGLVAAAASLGM